MTAYLVHLGFELRSGFRNRMLLLMRYLFPLMFYLMMGFIMGEINPMFIDTMIPAMVVFTTATGTLFGLPDALVAGRESGVFRNYRINGVPTLATLGIPAIAAILHTAVTSLIIWVTAPILFDAPAPTDPASFIWVFLLAVAAHTGLALLIGVVASSSQAAILWTQIVFIPSMILGGLMLPTSLLPDLFGRISRLLPASHAMNAFASLAYDGAQAAPSGIVSALALLGGALVALALAVSLFSWDEAGQSRGRRPVWGLLVFVPYLVTVFMG